MTAQLGRLWAGTQELYRFWPLRVFLWLAAAAFAWEASVRIGALLSFEPLAVDLKNLLGIVLLVLDLAIVVGLVATTRLGIWLFVLTLLVRITLNTLAPGMLPPVGEHAFPAHGAAIIEAAALGLFVALAFVSDFVRRRG